MLYYHSYSPWNCSLCILFVAEYSLGLSPHVRVTGVNRGSFKILCGSDTAGAFSFPSPDTPPYPLLWFITWLHYPSIFLSFLPSWLFEPLACKNLEALLGMLSAGWATAPRSLFLDASAGGGSQGREGWLWAQRLLWVAGPWAVWPGLMGVDRDGAGASLPQESGLSGLALLTFPDT